MLEGADVQQAGLLGGIGTSARGAASNAAKAVGRVSGGGLVPGIGTGLILFDVGSRLLDAAQEPERKQAKREAESLFLQEAVSQQLLQQDSDRQERRDIVQSIGDDPILDGSSFGEELALGQMIEARSAQLSEIAKRSFPSQAEVAASLGVNLR
mgnify:CR=1 FL=1